MKATLNQPITDFKVNYRNVREALSYFPINSMEGAYVSGNLWKLPTSWINGLATFVTESSEMEIGWLCSNLLHDIAGYVNKDSGFSPRCFRGGSVWDKD